MERSLSDTLALMVADRAYDAQPELEVEPEPVVSEPLAVEEPVAEPDFLADREVREDTRETLLDLGAHLGPDAVPAGARRHHRRWPPHRRRRGQDGGDLAGPRRGAAEDRGTLEIGKGSAMINEGDKAPAITVAASDGSTVDLSKPGAPLARRGIPGVG